MTRYIGDWISDVCPSDLGRRRRAGAAAAREYTAPRFTLISPGAPASDLRYEAAVPANAAMARARMGLARTLRSEERRVGRRIHNLGQERRAVAVTVASRT